MGGIKGRKSARRLAARRKAYDTISNIETQNPGKQQTANSHKMHRPGSNTR